jgi:hypothetical protein
VRVCQRDICWCASRSAHRSSWEVSRFVNHPLLTSSVAERRRVRRCQVALAMAVAMRTDDDVLNEPLCRGTHPGKPLTLMGLGAFVLDRWFWCTDLGLFLGANRRSIVTGRG